MATTDRTTEELARLRLQFGLLFVVVVTLAGWLFEELQSGVTGPWWLLLGAYGGLVYLIALLIVIDWAMIRKIRRLGDSQ